MIAFSIIYQTVRLTKINSVFAQVGKQVQMRSEGKLGRRTKSRWTINSHVQLAQVGKHGGEGATKGFACGVGPAKFNA